MFSNKAISRDLDVADVAHQRRDLVKLSELRGPPAPFAGDDLVLAAAVRVMAHDDRLNNAIFTDRIGQLGKVLLIEALARLSGIGMDVLER